MTKIIEHVIVRTEKTMVITNDPLIVVKSDQSTTVDADPVWDAHSTTCRNVTKPSFRITIFSRTDAKTIFEAGCSSAVFHFHSCCKGAQYDIYRQERLHDESNLRIGQYVTRKGGMENVMAETRSSN